MRPPPILAFVSLLGVGCTAPGLSGFTFTGSPGPEDSTTTAGSADSDVVPTTGAVLTSTTGESDPGTTSIGSGSSGELTTTGVDPLAPPVIVKHNVGPITLQTAGPIEVEIATEHADGVHMRVDDGDPIELSPAQLDAFAGEIIFYTALDNGDHKATFVAWRDALKSEELVVDFTVALPKAGTGLYWDADASLGPATVVALGVTPGPITDQRLLELGTYHLMGQPRCYLRRRDLGGAWGPGDLRDLTPGSPCTAIDLAVAADGTIYILANRLIDGAMRWWLGKYSAWDGDPLNVGSGVTSDTAKALALSSTHAAVCGTSDNLGELNAAAWIFSPNKPGKILEFEYLPQKDQFDEIPRDCVLTEDHLFLAGEATGVHEENQISRERHFLLEVDLLTSESTWIVAAPGPGTQSKAQAIALGTSGRLFTGGYTCEDLCEQHSELRMFIEGGELMWQQPLADTVFPARAAAWSPAGYLVLVSAMDHGPGVASFLAQAYEPLEAAPLWSFEHQDAPALHSANAVVIGPYGQIYAGGVTAGGYPAVAFIAP